VGNLPIGKAEAGQPLDFEGGKLEHRPGRGDMAGGDDLVRGTATELEYHARGELDAGKQRLRIDRALEPVARVRDDAELAAGRGDGVGIEPGALDEDAGRPLTRSGRFPADDAADAQRPRVVSDDAHALVEPI